MGFAERFRKANKNIAASSTKVYLSNILRLARLGDLTSIPDHPRWLNKKILGKLKKQNLNTKKILATAAVKVFRLFDKEPGEWAKVMYRSTREYNEFREKREKTPREKAAWPKGGYPALWKAALLEMRKVNRKPTTLKGLRELQDVWVLAFYASHTPRLIDSVRIDGSGPNVLKKRGKTGWTLVLGKHKTSKHLGASVIRLDNRLNEITTDFVTALRTFKKPFLLVNAKGNEMSNASLSKRLLKITLKAGLAGFSAQIMRVLKSTEHKKTIDKAEELQQEMGHGQRESRRYAKK